ncbi:MAG: hypothetical protein JOY66_06640 [Acetobacteraceae bacterium]|nr:hypothetical protein [Acetobacteraceae bacterium]
MPSKLPRPPGRSRRGPLPQVVRRMARGIAALAACAASSPLAAQAPPRALTLTCTNPASGATWQITIDYQRATVDSNPARVGEAAISWHDPRDGGHYTLDRASGDLTVVIASSTGGYFLHDHCRPQ